MKDDIKQVGIYVVGAILMIIGWFLNSFMEQTKTSFANLYDKQDNIEMVEIEFWKGESFYYRDRYYNLLEDSKCNN